MPDLNVAVVWMRGMMAFSEPARQRGREPYNFDLFLYAETALLLRWKLCEAERKDRCESARLVTRLSKTGHCCFFVCQPGKAEAFRRSQCRNPPSLKTHKRPWHADQHRQKWRVQKSARANRQRVETRTVVAQTDTRIKREMTHCLIVFPIAGLSIRWYLTFTLPFTFASQTNSMIKSVVNVSAFDSQPLEVLHVQRLAKMQTRMIKLLRRWH